MSDMTPRVSVVMPVYNGVRHLADSLASIAAQTLAPLEVIVIDDGSKDGSAALVKDFAADHPELNIHLVTQENRGQSASRNRAAELAAGDFLAFLDQDDTWYPEHLARLCAAFAKPDVGLAFSDFDEIDGDGNLVVLGFIRTFGIHHPRTSIVEWITSDTMVLPSAAVVRTSAFRSVGGFSEDLIGYEDDELWIRLFRAGWRSKYIARSLGMFRIHAGSSSTRASFRRSRVIFFERVSAMLPDLAELRRYYTSDVLLPRLLAATLADYRGAIRAENDDDARDAARTAAELLAASGSTVLSKRTLRLLHRPRLVRWGVRWSRALPNGVRERLDPTRTAR